MLGVKKKMARSPFVRRLLAAALFVFFLIWLLGGRDAMRQDEGQAGTYGRGKGASDSLRDAMLGELGEAFRRALYASYLSGYSFSLAQSEGTCFLLQEQMDSVLPFYGYARQELGQETARAETLREILLEEAREGSGDGVLPESQGVQGQDGPGENGGEETAPQQWEGLLQAEDETASGFGGQPFVPHARQVQLDMAALQDYETLLQQFYTVDANTMAGSDQLDVEQFLEKDMTVSKESPGPQILIYHTHSQEGFADSVPGDDATNIQGVGERLARILEDTYGYEVLHYDGEYDVNGRDDAYANALPDIAGVLEENPSIQVVIDLHRDEMPEGTRLVTDLDGRPTARFMFFNGLSRTKTTGNISYLYNQYLEDNLAFSFQMQRKAQEYYPGLARKIYLKGYRYNMHLAARYLLIELGAQNNTLEEAMNACDPLAHILDLVLSGA